jgi:hypothetical protein
MSVMNAVDCYQVGKLSNNNFIKALQLTNNKKEKKRDMEKVGEESVVQVVTDSQLQIRNVNAKE